jgi:hypothetical protein
MQPARTGCKLSPNTLASLQHSAVHVSSLSIPSWEMWRFHICCLGIVQVHVMMAYSMHVAPVAATTCNCCQRSLLFFLWHLHGTLSTVCLMTMCCAMECICKAPTMAHSAFSAGTARQMCTSSVLLPPLCLTTIHYQNSTSNCSIWSES